MRVAPEECESPEGVETPDAWIVPESEGVVADTACFCGDGSRGAL